MLANSERYSDQDLHEQALAEVRNGGRGRANAVLTLPLKLLTEAYLALSPEARAAPVIFNNHQLDGNVPAVLESVAAPNYRNL
jgi:molybdenum-dependent DNA-binding transcriptional regulator ModE